MTNTGTWTTILGLALLLTAPSARGQERQWPDPEKAITRSFDDVHHRLLEMAEDFPADKYGFKPKPGMRSFGEVIVHVLSGTIYAAKAGRGENVEWGELDPKNYPDKAAIVAAFRNGLAEADATLKGGSAPRGLLVAYYRLNGLVPPASRPRK
jgi:hypothetical protein